MPTKDPIAEDLGRQIMDTHERLNAAIRDRLPNIDREGRERYLALLSVAVGKLEERDKSMREVLQAIVAEALPMVMAELSSG